MIEVLGATVDEYLSRFHMPNIRITDVVEILIISFVVYQILVWIRNTKAWSLLKGFLVILGFLFIAALFNMTTILWIAEKGLTIFVIAFVVVLQPELRRALEQLGRKNILSNLLSTDQKNTGRYSDHTVDEIVRASFAMGAKKTGALMVLECHESLQEYEKTGISINADVSNQLLINIFEHNTPLHDGAVIFRNDKVVSATCYLPLSDNPSLSKALGTRHRAGVGISEATDSMTVIVSEENGKVSVAYHGELFSGLNQEALREKLELIQDKPVEEQKRTWSRRKSQTDVLKRNKSDKE